MNRDDVYAICVYKKGRYPIKWYNTKFICICINTSIVVVNRGK